MVIADKYIPKRFSAWWWGVIDTQTQIYVKGDRGSYKLLLFPNRKAAQQWCDTHN